MDNKDEIIISFSKKKLSILTFGALLFVCLGLWFLLSPPEMSNPLFTPLRVRIAGAAAVIFFGIGLIIFVKKFFDNKPALIISNNGITDNAGGTSAGFIPWNDVLAIDYLEVAGQKFITVILKNPEVYINRQQNKLVRYGMRLNLNNYGTPVNISANALKCKLDELKKILDERMSQNAQVREAN